MADQKKAAPATAPAKKPKPRKLSNAQLAARIARDSAELLKRTKPKVRKKA